jgi:hypothetical protein
MPKKIFASVSPALLLSLLLLGMHVPEAAAQPAAQGQWSTVLVPKTNHPLYAPINPIHAALLRNGKVLIIAGSGNCPPTQTGCPTGAPYGPSNGSGATLYDPPSGRFTPFSVTWDMFCNNMVLLPDGRALIVGGTIQYNPNPFLGAKNSSIFDPLTSTFTDGPDMAHGRWYPSLTALGNGQAMTFSGVNECPNGPGSPDCGSTNSTVEIYDPVSSVWSRHKTRGGPRRSIRGCTFSQMAW